MKQSALNSPRLLELRRKKHKSTRRKVVVILVIFFVVILGLSFASRINKININQINISGNKVVETKEIEDIIKNKISDHYLWLFPKTNFLIYPKRGILNELNNKLKRLKDISISINNFRILEISVSEYEGKYLWCGISLPDLTNSANQKCYFLDDNGYIFDEAPYFSGEVYFKFYGNGGLSNEIPIGTYFLKDKFVKIIEFKDAIQKLNLNSTAFWLDNDSEADFSISGEPMTGPRIIFKLDEDFGKLAENLQAAVSTEPLRTELKTKLSSLLYLDLRFGNKVYYKFK